MTTREIQLDILLDVYFAAVLAKDVRRAKLINDLADLIRGFGIGANHDETILPFVTSYAS